MKVLIGAFGDPGHAFPAIALGVALGRAGHDVTLETWRRWQADVEAEGMTFAPAPEYDVFPTEGRHLKPYEAVARATVQTRELVARVRPDVVVADILTLAPALAAELEGIPAATLVPHVDPRPAPGFPPYSVGARLPQTALGRRVWGTLDPLVHRGLVMGRDELNETRRRLGLPPQDHLHNGISRQLCLVATFPQLEYPRPAASAPNTHVIGPLAWEPPAADVDLTFGDPALPLVLVAPSTAQDAEHRLLRAALTGLADLPVRVLATTNRRALAAGAPRPAANTHLVDWVSYARTMPHCDVVLTHAGHGTMVRALQSGCAVVAVPAAGDMNENAARVTWAGAGVRVPRRRCTPAAVRLAVALALEDDGLRERARALRDWAAGHDAGAQAAGLLERLAARTPA
jgi:UDP:flavonoid glycosyltransferase YjiC (YdhE family)